MVKRTEQRPIICRGCGQAFYESIDTQANMCSDCLSSYLVDENGNKVVGGVPFKCKCGHSGVAQESAVFEDAIDCPQCHEDVLIVYSPVESAVRQADTIPSSSSGEILPAPKRHMAPIESECIDSAYCDLMAAENMLEIASNGSRHMFTDEMTEMRRDIEALAYRILDLHNRYRQFGGKPLSEYGRSFAREKHNEASQHKA